MDRNRFSAFGILSLVLILFLSGCTGYGSTSDANVTASPNTVVIQNFAFNPPVLTVSAGTTVTWTNQDSATHRIKSDTFNSQDLVKGDSYSFMFDTPGSYEYTCAIHPSMKGTITVN